MELPALLSACSLDELTRIDVGLEGDWSPTVRTVWTRNDGRLSMSDIVREHESFRPSLELYFVDGWLGMHCHRWNGRVNVLDESLVARVIDDVEAAIASSNRTQG